MSPPESPADLAPPGLEGPLGSFVGGSWRRHGDIVRDENPAHPDRSVADVALADGALATEAVEAAAEAARAWARTSASVRSDVLRRTADVLTARRERIGTALASEEGKTLAEAMGETDRAAAILRYYAGQALEPDGETYPSQTPDTLLYARRVPLGAILAITPWNFPIAIPAWKIAPALAFGNTVVWKPAELVPLTSVHLAAAFQEAGLPPGVLNLVVGRSATVGRVLSDHPTIAAVSFTGSNRVGRALQSRAVGMGKRVQLELGGKNPALILADADPERAVEQVARGAFLSAGQKCTATSRLIVEDPVREEVTDRLVALAASWRVGDPLDSTTQVGPLVSRQQLDHVRGLIGVAEADGATVVAGGAAPIKGLDGHYLRPTIVTGAASTDRIAQVEVFGPVVAILAASDADEALRLANDTPFGLAASLFTSNLAEALRFARECSAGVVKVNQETAGIEFQAPFGGMKDSSSGSREQGKAAREFLTEWKTISMTP